MSLIKTGQFIDKSNVKITYEIHIMTFIELNSFLSKKSYLKDSFIKLINEQYIHVNDPVIQALLLLKENMNIISFYERFFQDIDRISFSIMTDPNSGLKTVDIGSTIVLGNTNTNIVKIFNVIIIKKYQGNGLCSIIMNEVIKYLFNQNTYEFNKLMDQIKIERITLDVLHDNEIAIGCYKKLGFEIDTIKDIQTVNSNKFYEMNLNFKSYFTYLIKLKILELLESGSQKLKDQINVLIQKL